MEARYPPKYTISKIILRLKQPHQIPYRKWRVKPYTLRESTVSKPVTERWKIGATVNAPARVLLRAGAAHVEVLIFARVARDL